MAYALSVACVGVGVSAWLPTDKFVYLLARQCVIVCDAVGQRQHYGIVAGVCGHRLGPNTKSRTNKWIAFLLAVWIRFTLLVVVPEKGPVSAEEDYQCSWQYTYACAGVWKTCVVTLHIIFLFFGFWYRRFFSFFPGVCVNAIRDTYSAMKWFRKNRRMEWLCECRLCIFLHESRLNSTF